MLKFLLLEIIKAYTKKLIMPRERKKQYSHYFIAFFSVVGLVLLLIADYIYFYSVADDAPSSIGVLLIISTALFILALAIKLVCLWLNRKEIEEQEVLDTGGIVSLAKDFLPIIVSMVPVGIIAYIIWAKIQVKVFGKKLDFKDAVKRLF